MQVHQCEIIRSTTADTDIVDLTGQVTAIVGESGVTQGQILVSIPGSTASVTTIEFESGAVADLKAAIERLAPRSIDYQHDVRWGDGNGYSHVRAALLGPSVTLPVAGGRPVLGTWQQIILVDFDNRPRERRIFVQVSGIK